MNASSLAAPKACVSKPCRGCCPASKCKHTTRAHTTGQAASHNFLHVDVVTEQGLLYLDIVVSAPNKQLILEAAAGNS